MGLRAQEWSITIMMACQDCKINSLCTKWLKSVGRLTCMTLNPHKPFSCTVIIAQHGSCSSNRVYETLLNECCHVIPPAATGPRRQAGRPHAGLLPASLHPLSQSHSTPGPFHLLPTTLMWEQQHLGYIGLETTSFRFDGWLETWQLMECTGTFFRVFSQWRWSW